MADRIALVRMQDQFRFRRRAGGEIQQQWVGGTRFALRVKQRRVRRRRPRSDATRRAAHGDTR